MVVFTFVNSGDKGGDGGYYIALDRETMGWRELPHDLDLVMEDVRRKGEEVEGMSIGADGDWFLRTNARHAWKTEHTRADMISNVDEFELLFKKAGFSLAQYAIQLFAFMPDPTGYVTVLHKTDGSVTRCAWHNVPQELDAVLEREAPKGVRHVSVGVNGSYVLILNSGVVRWGSGVPVQLHQLLEDAERSRRPVATVSLSLISSTRYFVEFEDGASCFSLPQGWHNSINNYTAQALRAKTHIPRYAHPAQFGSFDPATSYGGGANPGPTPFASNPYISPTFTGMPQQPVFNINVYNVQQPQQQRQEPSTLEKYDGLITLLGGALKLAGAVLGAGIGSGFSF